MDVLEKNKFKSFGVDCNPIQSLGFRDAAMSSVIVCYGNTWIDLSEYAYSKIAAYKLC